MGQVNHTTQTICASVAALGFFAFSALPLGATDAPVRMQGTFNEAAANAAKIVVSGRAGRFDRVAAGALQIPLQLEATLGEGASGRKIVGSELFLKQSGAVAGAPATDARDGTVPRSELALERTFDFEVDPVGPLAQNAIALCNGNASSTALTMSLPIVWRVTTGRFNFKWVNYDHVAPSDEIVSNPEFYADRETQEIDIAASVPVRCDGAAPVAAAQAPAAASAPAKPVAVANDTAEEAAPAKKAVGVTPDPVSNAMLVSHKAIEAEETPAKPVSVATSEMRMVCDGGMVRQTGSNAIEVCLCPGNTRRVETATNTFACERKVGRR